MPRFTAGLARAAALLIVGLALAACISPIVPAGSGPPLMSPRQARALGPAPVQGARVSFAVMTMTGIPGTDQIALDQALQTFATTRNLAIVPYGDSNATYHVEGYISAIGDVNRVILVYVWDVYDADGNRLHRFSGQEQTKSGAVDPWAAVSVGDINNAARDTIDAFSDWAHA